MDIVYAPQALVRHRIDGLESQNTLKSSFVCVRHRIDGLDTLSYHFTNLNTVRHRIDGLEIGD